MTLPILGLRRQRRLRLLCRLSVLLLALLCVYLLLQQVGRAGPAGEQSAAPLPMLQQRYARSYSAELSTEYCDGESVSYRTKDEFAIRLKREYPS